MMATRPDHLFVGCEGALYDTRRKEWSKEQPLRPNYRYHHREIRSVADLKACLRAGKHTWPGGYACYFVTSDGAVLSFEAVREELRNVMDSIRHNLRDGWKVVGMGCTADDDEPPVCDHTGMEID